MKITKDELKKIINEVLLEDADKFTKALDALKKKQNILKVNSAKIGVDIAKVLNAQAQEQENTASDALDSAENRGEDVSKESETLDAAKEKTQKTKDGVTAANNALKTAQKGGVPSN